MKTKIPHSDRREVVAGGSSRAIAARGESWGERLAAWLQSTLGLALVGSLLMYAAFPPWDLWPLAWIAPTPWLLLCRQNELRGRRPYGSIWLAGFVFWLGAIHWLRLPHWVTYFGWLALAFYLAFYVPVFIGLTRVAVQRLRISIIVAAPVVWTGLELARGHLLSGFTMGSLGHTQYRWTAVIQTADVIGGYGISGLVMFVAACAARMLPWQGRKFAWWPLAPAAIVLAAAANYGAWRMAGNATRCGPTVALIQGSIDSMFGADPNTHEILLKEYLGLSQQALQQAPHLDLLVWPETMYRYPLLSFAPDFKAPSDWDETPAERATRSQNNLRDLQDYFKQCLNPAASGGANNPDSAPAAAVAAKLPPALLLGIDAVYITNDEDQHFNSAQFVDPAGQPLARYDKMHPVMFGEYIPLADWFPVLYRITPLTGGLKVGTQAVSQKLGDVRYAPNICYETVIPHLMRRQVLQLREQGEEPDVLVNLTNDGWFHGSSELDMHLACGVFRAVELRKPLVIAANTGFSASIDSDGRVVKQAARHQPEVIIAEVRIDNRRSLYLQYGDWFAGLCLIGIVGLAVVGGWDRFRAGRERRHNPADRPKT